MGLRITTWNVNGIRNPFGYHPWRDKRTFDAMFDILEADIVVMQELKIQRKDLRDDMVLVPGWDCYFSLPRHKKGYSGVGIYTRQSVCAPIHAEEGVLGVLCPPGSEVPYNQMEDDLHVGGYLSPSQMADLQVNAAEIDAEGRCVILEFPAFVLFGIYSPANSSGLRDEFRRDFQIALDTRIRNLAKLGKRVVVCGDLNVSREEIDTANAEETKKKEGISHQDYVSTPNRRLFNQLLEGGVVFGERDEGREEPIMWDVCRGFHPDRAGMFTHWEQKINARPGNFGSRIDFILCSLAMKSWFLRSDIQEGLLGSDHCPVFAVLKDEIPTGDTTTFLKDIMNPSGYFEKGMRSQEYSAKHTPAFSARLMPEFHRRRNIKDMFGTSSKSTTAANSSDATFNATPRDTSDLLPASHSFDSDQSSPSKSLERSLNNTQSPDRKRAAPSPSLANQSKKTKSSTISDGKGQQSLKGFFKPKSAAVGRVLPERERDEIENLSQEESSLPPDTAIYDTRGPAHRNDSQAGEVLDDDDGPVIDPGESKQNWSRLFAKPTAPRCEHGEACKIMKTKKAGFNCGREFWICQRPLGPSGNKERNTEWRCPYFMWSSEWTGG